MLLHVKIGCIPEPDALVLTPEFFELVKEKLDRSYGVYLRTRLYPWVRNWLVVSGVPEGRTPPVAAFTLKNETGSFPVFIPIKQCDIFEGKVIGRAMDIATRPLGFLRT